MSLHERWRNRIPLWWWVVYGLLLAGATVLDVLKKVLRDA